MADHATKPPAGDESQLSEQAQASGAEQKSSSSAPRYNAAGWKERARSIFDASPHAVAGALHGGDPDATYTEGDVRKALKQWQDAPGVEEGNGADSGS